MRASCPSLFRFTDKVLAYDCAGPQISNTIRSGVAAQLVMKGAAQIHSKNARGTIIAIQLLPPRKK